MYSIGPGTAMPGVVHEAREPAAADRLADLLGGRVDRGLVGHVDAQRLDAPVARGAQPLGVLVAAHSGEDVEAERREVQRARVTDAGRGAGDHDGAAGVADAMGQNRGVSGAGWVRRSGRPSAPG